MRRLYFLRHGKAVAPSDWRGEDGLRPLAPEGEAAVRREAAALAGMGLALDLILTSPLARARRTAELVAGALGLEDRLAEDEHLSGGFDAGTLLAVLAAHDDPGNVLLVGHEPALGAVVAELIGGGRVALAKGGLARVDLDADGRRGELVWLLTPALLGGE